MSVASFFRWWLGRLAELLPERLLHGRRMARRTLLVEETETGMAMRLRQRGRERPLAAAANTPRVERVVVLPATKRMLVREVQLPGAAAADTREALELNMDTFTPFRAEEVFFGFRRSPGKPAGADEELSVQLATVPRAVVDGMLAGLAGMQLEPTGELDVDAEAGRPGLVFEPAPRSRALAIALTGGLVAANLALLVMLVAVPWQRQGERLQSLEARVQAARQEAEAVRRIEAELDARRAGRDFLARQTNSNLSLTLLLEELSQRLPDDSWLTSLQVAGDTVRMQGFSQRAAALIGALQGSAVLAEAQFGSPVVRDPRTGGERFDLKATIVAPAADEEAALRTVASRRVSN